MCNRKEKNDGCSKHMTRYPSKFISLKRDKKERVTFGDNLSSKIVWKETMAVRNKVKAKNVLLIEKLKPNILIVSQTCEQENICTFDFEKCQIRKKDLGRLVGTAVRNSNNVYILENEEQCYMSMIDESWLWRRMGHLNFENESK